MKKLLIIVGVGLVWVGSAFCQETMPFIHENTPTSNSTVSSAIADDEKDNNATEYIITLPLPALNANLTVSEQIAG